MEFRLLGSFEARHDGRPVQVSRRRQERCLLAILLLHAGRTVTTNRLIELLWGGNASASARATVHTYVGRVRSGLAPFGVQLGTRDDGYVIEADGHAIDAGDFLALTRQAAAEKDPGRRVHLHDQALALWRGPLLDGLADGRLRHRLDGHLVELRLGAMEQRAEDQLAMGRHDQVVEDLAPLVQRHPARERLIYAQMTALSRCGRAPDALELYASARGALVRELGIEPGAELQALQTKILRGDTGLERPTPLHVVRVRDQWLPWNVGGHPALEFCNTYSGWDDAGQPGSEWLRAYQTLAVWAGHVGLADAGTVTRLVERAEREPDEAAAALAEARALRSALYACLTNPQDARAFDVVAGFADAAARVSVYGRGEDGLGRWQIADATGLELVVHAVARSAAEFLADPRRFSVRACRGEQCGWLFLDVDGTREHCSVATCRSQPPPA